MKTWNAKPESVEQKWFVVDATGKTLGRLATQIAMIVTGKNKPTFTPGVETGDNVIVINAEKIKMTGNKVGQKVYRTHSRFFGSLREFNVTEMMQKDPSFIVLEAVEGMLPNNKLANRLIEKVKAYAGPNHPHSAQKPETLNLK